MSSPPLSPSSHASLMAAEALKEKKQAKQRWIKSLKDALDADSWGQSIEATEQYEKLYRTFELQLPELSLSSDERSTCLKVAHAVSLRMATLQGQEAAINDAAQSGQSQAIQKLTLDELRSVQGVLEDLFEHSGSSSSSSSSFPIALRHFSPALDKQASQRGAEVFIAHEDRLEKEETGSLLPPKVKAGLTTISIYIDKIGLKDAQTYINSFLTISVADAHGQVLESQDTPKTNQLKPNYVMLGNTVHIQTPMEEIQSKNLCLFFEFKHYKPAKKKISTRCFALLESRELDLARNQSQVCLELYKKPTDFSRRSLSLHTIKQLYLHLEITFTKH